MSEFKTNVMRILEKAKIDYAAHEYPHGKDAVDGISVAKLLGQNPDCVFKTLVTKGVSGSYFVFVVPVAAELDLKKAAKSDAKALVIITDAYLDLNLEPMNKPTIWCVYNNPNAKIPFGQTVFFDEYL